jgi:ABC-type dipeptide/oligopeptide/nickel transport system ATPase component
MAQRVFVMYAGRKVEEAPVEECSPARSIPIPTD